MSWNKSTVTDAGVDLLNESLAGHTLTITSAAGGAGLLDDDELKAATDVVDQKQTFALLGLCRGNSYSEVIAGNPVNQEISAKTSE